MSIEEINKVFNNHPIQEHKLINQRNIDLVGITEQSDISNIREEIHESKPIQRKD